MVLCPMKERRVEKRDDERIFGRNAVLAFLEAESQAKRGVRGGRINKIFMAPSSHPDKRVERIRVLARERGVPIMECERKRMDQMVEPDQAHQGVVAQLSPVDYWELADLFQLLNRELEQLSAKGVARESALNQFVVGVLDGIEDPHNLGAIIRVAECAGVKALLVPDRRSASLTGVVAKTSAVALCLSLRISDACQNAQSAEGVRILDRRS